MYFIFIYIFLFLFCFAVVIIIIIIIYSSFTREFPTGVSAFLQGTLGII